jgi:hypothetical protein
MNEPYKNYKPLKKEIKGVERSPMLMDWQNQHSKNVYTTKVNLHVQCNSHQNPNDITEIEKSTLKSTKDCK